MKRKAKTLGAVALTIALSCNMLFLSALAVDEPPAGCTGDENCIAEQHTEVCPKYQPNSVDSNDAISGTPDTDTSDLLDDTSSDWSNPDKSWFNEDSEQTEYTLTTAAQLAGLIDLIDSRKDFTNITIKLGNNITLNDTAAPDWAETALEWDGGKRGFTGTFDGCGYSIIGLYSKTGLFGEIDGTVKNLTIDTANLTSTNKYIGAIAGEATAQAVIENCHVKNTTVVGGTREAGIIVGNCSGTVSACTVDAASQISGRSAIGGIVGTMTLGSVSGCENAATVSGSKGAGGIVGTSTGSGATISDCINTGSVTSTGGSVGGIIGFVNRELTVSDCTNRGAVQGTNGIGGIAGDVDANVSITGCVSEGSVTGKTNVGGILGNSDIGGEAYESGKPNTVSGCTVSAAITGETSVGGLVGNNVVVDSEEYADTSIQNNVLTSTASVSGTTSVGALIGSNGTDTDTGTVKNNFWPESAGTMASGSGAGSTQTGEDTIHTNNSSYKPDGTLTTPVPDTDGDGTIGNLGDAIDKIIGNGDGTNVPDVLKVTVTYRNGGHGTAPASETVTKGSKVTLPSMSNDGYYTFIGWSNGGATYTAGQEVPVMEDMIFTAQWRNDTPSTGGGGGSSDPTYSISLPSKVTGGEVSIQKRYAEKGETVTITVTPDDGYELDELIVTDSKGNELDLTDKGNGKFTFKMPAGRVEIEVSFQEIVIEPVNPFVDVSTSDYYYDAVLWAVENGVTNGTSATTFGPNMAVSRAQMVTFLWRAHGSPKATGTNPFTDVSTSDYYYDAVLWAVTNGVTNGTSDTTFSPDTAVTRSQAVTFQWRAAGSPVVSGSSFGDVATDAYYVNAVTWAVANGITNGTGGNTFSPDVVVSRAQAVTFLYREQE